MTSSLESGRVPDFFIVGNPKSGTTALYEMLKRHPQIFMPELKEPRFLAGDMYRWSPEDSTKPPGTLEQYLALFAPAAPGQLAGEASPLYLASAEAAGRIAELSPAARIIAVLREPAGFLRSEHMQLVQTHIENKNDLGKAIALEAARSEGRQLPDTAPLTPRVLQYSARVRYVEQLRRYHEVFGREQVLVLIYDDFRRENAGTVKQVLNFLEVEDMQVQTLEANPSVRVRSRRLHDALHAVSVGRDPVSKAAQVAIKTLAPRSVRRRALGAVRRQVVFAQPQEPDPRLMDELRRRFAPEVVALSEYLDRDLVTLWGYDSIA